MIEAPTQDDLRQIALSLIHAQQTVSEILHSELDGSKADLVLIQRALDSGVIDPEAEYTIRSLGLAFGKVFVNTESGYDWWMINDEYGRDPAIRYLQSTLTFHPQDMLLKRVERGEEINIPELYDGLRSQLREIIDGGVDGSGHR
ncbi:DUF3806 domain-containing protein [Comamonas fluminis]|uniref:DUF3806 domain-containing protein n=1 Tax=Comamonas fluminis TaxID=2796366 RepID=UPI001C4438DA|nr:DUF3806 domain-containing protein [Comamonas fluminis]